jgi:SAM-dependent methyltransferase
MEIKSGIPVEYDATHPNYKRWRRAREISVYRAEFVKSLVSNFIECRNLKILDIGSGTGATAKLFAGQNFVISLEKKIDMLELQPVSGSLVPVAGDAVNIPFKKNYFNLIILQDSIEHLILKNYFFDQLYNILAAGGIIYLSTPNKFSLINFIADPHWGLPVVSILKRKQIKQYFLKYFRKKDYNREDIAELLSLNYLMNKAEGKFELFINTNYAVVELMNGNEGLIWSDFHMGLLKIINKLGLGNIIIKLANDKTGLLNRFITPTFYLILKKK